MHCELKNASSLRKLQSLNNSLNLRSRPRQLLTDLSTMDVLRFLYFFLAISCIVLFFYVIYDRTNKRFWISLNAKRPKMQVAYGSAITILLFFLSFGVYARLIGHNMPICKNKTADVIAQSINPDCHSSALSTSLPDADIFIAINEWLDRLAFKVCDPHGAPLLNTIVNAIYGSPMLLTQQTH